MANKITSLIRRDPDSAVNYWKQYTINLILDVRLLTSALGDIKELEADYLLERWNIALDREEKLEAVVQAAKHWHEASQWDGSRSIDDAAIMIGLAAREIADALKDLEEE